MNLKVIGKRPMRKPNTRWLDHVKQDTLTE